MIKKVVCINDSWPIGLKEFFSHYGMVPPKKDDVYHVNEILDLEDGIHYKFYEYPPTHAGGFDYEHVFHHECFRDITDEEQSLDAEIAEALKAPTPKVKELEPVHAGGAHE